MAGINGTDVAEHLNGTSRADTINAGGGDDHVNSGAGNDIVDGGDGNDKIDAGGGDDTLIGGDGDDFLNGGGGSDTFVFNFVLSLGGETTISYGVTPLDPEYDINNDGKTSQPEFSQFAQDYQAWLAANLPAGSYQYAAPQADPLASASNPTAVDGDVSSITWTQGQATQTRYWEDSISTTGPLAIADSDGHDTIAQFQKAGPNVDTIVLNGLAALEGNYAALDALFDLDVSDVNSDGVNDSVLEWNGGSITLLGTSEWGTDVQAFFADDRVVLT